MAVWTIAGLAGAAGAAAPDRSEPRWSELTWSELTGARVYRAGTYREPANIRSVDDKEVNGRLVRIMPGKRKMVVESPYRKGAGNANREIELIVAPCRRYYVNAQFKDAVTSRWDPVVAKVEVIPGCRRPAKPPPER